MRKIIILSLAAILTMAMCGFSLATVAIYQHPELELASPFIGPNTQLPQATSGIPYSESAGPKAPLGQTFVLGTTWYDYQHNGTIEKMIALASSGSGGVHFCWMNGLEFNAVNRHVYYNYFNPSTGALAWPDVGYQVDLSTRAGYTTISNLGGGEAVVSFHQGTPTTSAVAYDFIEGFGAFQNVDIPSLSGWDATIWPHATVCHQNYIHVASCENRTTSWQRIAYSRSEDGGSTYTDWVAIDTVMSISQTCAASPVSNKVGIAYTQSYFNPVDLGPYEGLLVSQLNNGITLVESDDGVTWDFSAEQDITDLVEPDATRYPDSTWANGDTLRCYCDVSLLYDMNDNAHAAFTTKGLWFDARLASYPDSFAVTGLTMDASVIWHWSEEHDAITVIADGWYDVGSPNAPANESRGSGAWRSTCDRPSLGVDPTTGYLYCVYERCVEGDTSGGPVPSHGFANGEIYCSVSTDGGLNWSEGTNLTDTPSPEAIAGACMDEDYPSLARVVNDTLHVIYIEDKDAGGVVMTAPQEGIWTENPVKYQKVPAGLVPPGPPYVPNFEFHVGPSTAVEQPTLVGGTMPESYALHQNYPNPFNPETTIRFDVPQASPVSLRIYNVTGQLVRELTAGHRQAGSYEIHWNGLNDQSHLVPSGIYFYHMKAGDFTATRKMALIK